MSGWPQGRVSWDYSSGAARCAGELLRVDLPENMPSGTLIFTSRSLTHKIAGELSFSWVKLLSNNLK